MLLHPRMPMASTPPPLQPRVCLPRTRRERTKSCSWSRAGGWRGNSRYCAATQPALRSAALEAALRSGQREPFPVEAAATASRWERLFQLGPACHHGEEAEFRSIASFARGDLHSMLGPLRTLLHSPASRHLSSRSLWVCPEAAEGASSHGCPKHHGPAPQSGEQ